MVLPHVHTGARGPGILTNQQSSSGWWLEAAVPSADSALFVSSWDVPSGNVPRSWAKGILSAGLRALRLQAAVPAIKSDLPPGCNHNAIYNLQSTILSGLPPLQTQPLAEGWCLISRALAHARHRPVFCYTNWNGAESIRLDLGGARVYIPPPQPASGAPPPQHRAGQQGCAWTSGHTLQTLGRLCPLSCPLSRPGFHIA